MRRTGRWRAKAFPRSSSIVLRRRSAAAIRRASIPAAEVAPDGGGPAVEDATDLEGAEDASSVVLAAVTAAPPIDVAQTVDDLVLAHAREPRSPAAPRPKRGTKRYDERRTVFQHPRMFTLPPSSLDVPAHARRGRPTGPRTTSTRPRHASSTTPPAYAKHAILDVTAVRSQRVREAEAAVALVRRGDAQCVKARPSRTPGDVRVCERSGQGASMLRGLQG
jgi:hypothetical protein